MARDYSILHSLYGSVPQSAISTFQLLLDQIYTLNDEVQTLKKPKSAPQTIAQIEDSIQSRKRINLTQFLGVLSQPQNAAIPTVTSLPDANDPLSQDGGAVRFGGVLYVFNATTEPGTWAAVTASSAIRDTHANRATYSAITYPSIFYYETDRSVLYLSDGTNWLYVGGMFSASFASRPTDLGANDVGFLLWVSIYNHIMKWGGASWAFIDTQGGYFGDFAVAPPASAGWILCDGGATTYLAIAGADLAETAFTTPDEITAPSGVYRKSIAAYTGTINAAGAPGITGSTGGTVATNQAAVVAAHAVTERLDVAGVGIFVFDAAADADHASHNHTQDSHLHAVGTLAVDATGQPRNMGALPYFRR